MGEPPSYIPRTYLGRYPWRTCLMVPYAPSIRDSRQISICQCQVWVTPTRSQYNRSPLRSSRTVQLQSKKTKQKKNKSFSQDMTAVVQRPAHELLTSNIRTKPPIHIGRGNPLISNSNGPYLSLDISASSLTEPNPTTRLLTTPIRHNSARKGSIYIWPPAPRPRRGCINLWRSASEKGSA